tara:strand:- start:156 stop:989 length:834 start_codon:yes stop_codon:yes gene_type:complete
MSNKKTGRPVKKNVYYFPHYTQDSDELRTMVYKYKSEGYRAYYRLMERVAYADHHKVLLQNQTQKDMFYMMMESPKEVIDDLIRIMLDSGRIDREIWENEKAIWIQDFVDLPTINSLWYKRGKRSPQKNGSIERIVHQEKDSNRLSDTGNSEGRERNGMEWNEKEGKDGSSSSFDINSFITDYPNLDVNKSYDKYKSYHKDQSEEGFRAWLDKDQANGFNKKEVVFRPCKTGGFIAYCSKCGNKQFPKDKWAINDGSQCHAHRGEDFVPDNPKATDS